MTELNGGDELGELAFETLSYSRANSTPGVVEFTLDRYADAVALLLPGRRELKVYRDDEVAWVGKLLTIRLQSGGGSLSCAGLDLLSVLARRLISDDLDYAATDQLDIAWGLIDYTQGLTNGDLAITRGDEPLSGVDRDVSYAGADFAKIGDSIATLAGGDNGFDFEVDPDRVWRAYYPSRGTATAFVLEWGKNLESYTYDRDASATVTEQTTTGTAADTPVTAVEADSDAELDFGLLQDVTSYTDISDATLVDEHCLQDLANAAGELVAPSLVVRQDDPDTGFGSLQPGDTFRLRIDDGPAAQLDRDFRTSAVTYAVAANGEVTMKVDCEQEAI